MDTCVVTFYSDGELEATGQETFEAESKPAAIHEALKRWLIDGSDWFTVAALVAPEEGVIFFEGGMPEYLEGPKPNRLDFAEERLRKARGE